MSESGKEGDLEKPPAAAEVTTTSTVTTTTIITSLPAITDHERELASSAYQDFENGNYESCISTLNKLASSRSHDPKVAHNKAVAEYYLSEFTKTQEFRKSMAEVCNQAHINIDNVDALEDVDHCVVFFNQALILYHLHQYYSAIAILDKVFQFIEPLDETLAKKVCFQLLELYLCTHQPEKALGLIGYIENMLFGGSKSNSNGKNPSSDKEKEKEREGSKEKDSKESKNGKDSADNSRNEVYRPKLQQYKARCYIMLKSAKACKREIKSLMNSGMLASLVPQNIPIVYLRSQLEYLRGNYRKALKVLNSAGTYGQSSFKETGDNLAAMYYNNVGCIHFYMGKPHLGCFYFSKALQEYENAIKSVTVKDSSTLSARPVHNMDLTTRYKILYNLGLQFLHAGQPLQAFDCLVEAVQIYHTNSRLWLRLAECCIQAHKKDNSHDFQLLQRRKDMVQGIVGTGPHRKIFLSPFLSNDNKVSVQGQSSAIPMATLEFASLCLRNAFTLLPEESLNTSSNTSSSQSTSGDEAENSHGSESNVSVLVLPANSIQGIEIASLRNSILAASAYVALCLGDIVVALKHAETLLSQPKLCGVHRLLGHLYAGEALVLLDRIADAIEHLNPEHVKDISFSFPASSEDIKSGEKLDDTARSPGYLQNWFPNTVSTAKIIMQYNLTVAYTLRGELEKASESLRQQVGAAKGPGTEIPVQAIMLAIYIQLQQGFAEMAKSIIKQHLPQYR